MLFDLSPHFWNYLKVLINAIELHRAVIMLKAITIGVPQMRDTDDNHTIVALRKLKQ